MPNNAGLRGLHEKWNKMAKYWDYSVELSKGKSEKAHKFVMAAKKFDRILDTIMAKEEDTCPPI